MTWRQIHNWLIDDLVSAQEQVQELTQLRNQYHHPEDEEWGEYSVILTLLQDRIGKLQTVIVRHRRGIWAS